jgi:hypothetical protein
MKVRDKRTAPPAYQRAGLKRRSYRYLGDRLFILTRYHKGIEWIILEP